MSYSNFGNRGSGYGPRGTRAARRFGRPRFPRPPFRHAGPPRGPPFGVPWQPNNMFFQPHPLRGTPQFRPDGRRKRFCNYDVRFPAPNRLPVPPDCEEDFAAATALPPFYSFQTEINQSEAAPQLPLLGSEEERQQKITETADRLKQKLSSFSSDEMIDIWSEDPPSIAVESNTEEERRIPVVGYKSSELSLTYNDLKDIGKINSDNTQYPASVFYVSSNANSDVVLDENEDGAHLAIPSDQVTNLEDTPDGNECVAVNNWEEFRESADDPPDLEQSHLHGDENIEDKLDSDVQYQYDTPLASISEDQNDQQQDASRGIEVYSTDAAREENESETLNLQATSFPISSDLADQDVLQKNMSPGNEVFTNLDVHESVLDFNVHAENSNSNNCTLAQPAVIDTAVNNVALGNQLPRMMDNSLHSGPPRLSPPSEQELPIDFDPSTPPPILLKQDQPCILPPYSIPDLPPLFDPTEPPPNVKCLLGSKMLHEDANPAWSNAQNPIPAAYNNIEVHTGLSAHGGFMPQQLPLEIPSQGNVFLPPHIDSVSFPAIFPMLPSGHSDISTHVPSTLPAQMHAPSRNACVSSPSDLHCSANKDDGLDDMQEAMKFAKEMTNIAGKTDKKSQSSSKTLSKSGTSTNPVSGGVEFIALPPGKPKVKTGKLKRIKGDDTCSKRKIVPEEQGKADHPSSEDTTQDANVSSKDILFSEQERPKVVFNLNNKTKVVSTVKTKTAWKENDEKKNGMTQFIEPEKKQSMESEQSHAVPSITKKKNFESTLRYSKEEEKNLRRHENHPERTILFESTTNQATTLPHKKSQKDIHMEKSQHSHVSLYSKVNVQNSRNRGVDKSENCNVEWKNRIISRFLKMSRNDICNMVNNTSLRKFDIIMKRLVKEKKPALSLEMRHAQDEKMKLYDQQEFMKQLNAMLDTDAVVSVTDLPTEFIHHLNEVLQLDVQPDIHAESAAASSSQYGYLEDANRMFSPITTECADKLTMLNDISQECVRNKGRMTRAGCNKHVQAYNIKKVTKKIQTPAAVKERKRSSMGHQNAKKFDIGAITRSMEQEALLEDDGARGLETSSYWDENYIDRWTRKEREDPYAYRNLTKEEWEARYGMQANSQVNSQTNSAPSVISTKRIGAVNNKRGRGRKICPRRRHSSESSRHPPNTRHRSLEKDKHKKSRRHSDDRRHSTIYQTEHLESVVNNESNSSSSSSSSSSTSSSTSSSSSNSSDVIKLLRVIKENEKVAKKMTLNEAIRDEVNAEIERERKSRRSLKNRKNLKKRPKRAHKKRRKQSKKATRSSDSSSEKDNDNEVTDRLLTENEIKKEILENQVAQEVIVKEEVDISQEENSADAEFANASSFMENETAYLLAASQTRLESPLAQEIPIAAVNAAAQPHAEDRLPTVSPTQLKTKAQLKQMPETSDMNDNRVPLNVFTYIPENWSLTLNPASFAEDLDKPCQTADDVGSCGQDKAHPSSAIDSFTNQNNNTVHVSCSETDNNNATLQQSDATACTFAESSAKVQDGNNEISATSNNDTSRASAKMTATSASPASNVTPASAVAQKPGASKKIDIKTYYERTMSRRRMNEKSESKRNPAENPARQTSAQNSLAPKSTEPEIPVASKSTTLIPTYTGSIQDPRLAKLAANSCVTSSRSDIAQATSERNARQKEKRETRGSAVAELASRRPEENSNRIGSDSAVKNINQDKSRDKVSLAANSISVLSNVVVAASKKIAAPKSKKRAEVNNQGAASKKLQSDAPSDAKRFKNIRSEGGKELKLKKEMTKVQKAKKKSTATSKSSVNLVSTKVYFPTEETPVQGKKANNVNDAEKTKIERVQLISSRESKANGKAEPTIPAGNADNDELPHDTVKAKERSANLEICGRGNAEKAAGNIDAPERSSKTRNEGTRGAKCAKGTARRVEVADKKGQSASSELAVQAASVAASKDSENENVERINKDFPASKTETQPSAAARGTEPSLNYADQGQIRKSNGRDLSVSAINRDVSSIPELDATSSRADSVDGRSKENQVLLSSNIEINNPNESNVRLDAADDASEGSPARKTAGLQSSVSCEDPRGEQRGTENSDISPSDSVGSPFKGFLQETMVDFEQPKLSLDVNYVTRATDRREGVKSTIVEGRLREDYETLQEPGTDYANDDAAVVNENFNIAFDTLLASDKECAASERSDKSRDLTAADESGEGHVRKSSGVEIATTMLHDEANDINIADGSETERQTLRINKEGYASSCAGLAMKEAMFIGEEEIIPGEARSRDLTSKLKTATDPSLSDALEATISDDALRLAPDGSQGIAEHLDGHMYLEMSATSGTGEEKAPCDKLPGFDSDEHHLDDIFYLDDRLRGTSAFDNKEEEEEDDECGGHHFSVDRQSPRYDITPAVTPPETTATMMVVPCADLLSDEMPAARPVEECKFDLNVSSADNDLLLAGTSLDGRTPSAAADTPRTLNVPTKAALKEAATTSLFLKSPSDVPTATKEVALAGTSDKALRQNEAADPNYQASAAWRVNAQQQNNNKKTRPLEAHDNTAAARDFEKNVNRVSTTRNGTCSEAARKAIGAAADRAEGSPTAPAQNFEKLLRTGVQRTPVVELRKMKELDRLLEKRGRGNSPERMRERVHDGQRKYNGTILHKLKADKRRLKRQPKDSPREGSLVKRLKRLRRSGKVAEMATREAILARMLEIDLEMHKLATEKLKLHELLRGNVPSIENYTTISSDVPMTREDDRDLNQFETQPSTLTLQNISEVNRVKRAPSSKPSPIKERKRTSPEDNEGYTQRTKMPVIKWKKKPRLEQTFRREEAEKEEEEEEDPDETTEQQTSTSVSKRVENDLSAVIASEEIVQKPESNAVTTDEAREEEATGRSACCDIDSRPATVCPDKSAADKSADEGGERQDIAAEGETERVEHFDAVKENDILPPSEVTRPNYHRPSSRPVRDTPNPSSIYSDDSTWQSDVVQNTVAAEMHAEGRRATGLVLLDETLKKELAKSRKKAIVRKKKQQQLDNFLKTVNNLTIEEEELPLSKLYIKKLRQKRDLLDTLSSQRKEDTDLVVDPNVLKNIDDVINAVVENRVDDNPYESEVRATDDVPATSSNASPVPQPEKHQFYVDAEANANSDWPCRPEETVEEEVAPVEQDSNDVPGTDGSNHVFKAVSQDKVPFYEERNVEPDSSITPEETLMETDFCERDRSKDCSSVTSRNFDIKVSVPKTLIKDDFSLGLLQKLKEPEEDGAVAVGTGLVDSTTNVFSADSEKVEEKDKSSSQSTSQVKDENVVVEDKKDEEGKDETKDKPTVDANEREETVDSASTNAPSAPQSVRTAKSGYSTENEESGDSVSSNGKAVIIHTERESSVSNSTVEKTDTKQSKKSDVESEQLSNDVIIASKQDCQSAENAAAAREEEKNNPDNKSHEFERILDHNEQSNSNSSVPADLMSERSEESNVSVEQKFSLERTSTSAFSAFNKAKGSGEPSRKLRRKHANSLAPVRRSTRNSNENIKPGRTNEVDGNSSNSEQREPCTPLEKDLTTRSRSKSPSTKSRDERPVANNVPRRNRVSQKVPNPASSRKAGAESETRSEDSAKHLETITESAVVPRNRATRKRKQERTEWQIKNCKVRLTDCKPALLKYIDPKTLDRFGIIAADNPHPSSDSSCVQRTCDQDAAMIPTAATDKDFCASDQSCDKERFRLEIEILQEKLIKESNDKDLVQESVSHAVEIDQDESRMQYTVHKGPILDIKIFENSFLAASEDSKIYRYSQKSNGILNIYKGHKSAVTCLYICKPAVVAGVDKNLVYSGSLDGTLRCYDIMTGALIGNPAQIKSPIQCMDQAWGMIFIGTKSGHVSRFHIEAGAIKEESIPFSEKSVLALKATNEGPRRILIIASRNQPISIRDALTGLFLRTISGQKSHTVYSLLRHDNLIYCGTSSTSINVFDFTTGEQAIQYDAGVGIVCMRLHKQLLFAGCYDGNIYVFDINTHKLVCNIRGPGNMLLSVEVVNNKIIAGSKDKRLHLWQMPTQVRALL
ncbi:PREDICTED: uncharacterized protein LOC105454836 isoform X2 [Wasmannia auropunctata]|uniref:uncharacterized protein LOC105454836 isoform X2 n=1 Tax=Wasmannia auropunctata TaxID=64793 RepID=UPI0005EF3ECA|nr:PREDICTED: uncharacterized protein LOC105454836 isoform X2 [Wasmannia auropunctata]